jgi:hypothetical protein
MYHGWADPLVSSDTSLIMYKRISDAVGSQARMRSRYSWCRAWDIARAAPARTSSTKSARSIAGSKPDEKPQSIEAAHLTAGAVDRTRPLCSLSGDGRTTTAAAAP